MLRRTIIKLGPCWLAFLLTLVWGAAALAGGFWITAESPASSSDPELTGAVLVVRAYGCGKPMDATLSGAAEGIVHGRRQSLPLQFTLTSTGVYAVEQQWPSQGVWVLAITGEYSGITSSLLVELGPNGKAPARHKLTNGRKKEVSARRFHRQLATREIEAALQTLAGKTND